MRRNFTGRRRRTGTCCALLLAVAGAVSPACTPAGDEPTVAPLDAAEAEAPAHAGSTASTPAPSDPTTRSPSTEPAARPPGATPADTASLRAQVDRILERYARALTDLASDPERRARPGSPERAAWDRTVLAGSVLSEDLLGALVRRHREERMVVRPGPGGLSYRHRPLAVEPPRDGTISFTWCGWSPGIGVDADDGSVLDDGVAHAHGTGQLRLVEGHWMLELLDELDLSVLPPGSPDPCPAEVDELARTERGEAQR